MSAVPAAPAASAVPATPPPAARRGIFDPALLQACISCGFCLSVCPTYQLTLDERSSPRGRITLMRALEEGRLDADDPTLREQSSFCLGCRACETVCPAGVQYGHLLEQWRDHQWRGHRTPPLAAGLRVGMRMTPAIAAAGAVRGAARTTGAPAPDKVHLMLGCAERAMFPGVSRAVRRLLPDRLVDVPAKQGCCGAMHAHNGDSATSHAMAEQLGAAMPGTVLTTAGGCGAHVAGVIGRDRVRELSEYLVQLWHDQPDTAPPLHRLTVAGRPARAGLQDSCHLRNGMKVTAEPRDLIGRVCDYVELPSAGSCCGSAGTYSLLRPKDSQAVLAKHLDEIEAADLDYLVVVNPVCQRQMLAGVRRRRLRTKVLHLAELLALSAGTPGGTVAAGAAGGTGSSGSSGAAASGRG